MGEDQFKKGAYHMAKVSPQFSVTVIDTKSGPIYKLYLNGKWDEDFTSLNSVTVAIQSIIMGVYKNEAVQ